MANDEDENIGLSILREFVLPPESLQELFQGLPALYNPPNVVKNLRKFPIQNVASSRSQAGDAYLSIAEQLYSFYPLIDNHRGFTVKALLISMLYDVVLHPWTKYWLCVFASLILYDFGPVVTELLWFLLGVWGIFICNSAIGFMEKEDNQESFKRNESAENVNKDGMDIKEIFTPTNSKNTANTTPSGAGTLRSYSKSQGWMCTLPPTPANPYPGYNPQTVHIIRSVKAVFIRLHGPILIVSFPHAKHNIPKRRLWNDPAISTDYVFVRHQHFNLWGSKVQIVPEGLAQRRYWSRKYPIAITFACRDKFCGKLIEPDKVDNQQNQSGTGVANKNQTQSLKGKVYREEESSTGKTIYLFARTDREKDDWFRRLISASKTRPIGSSPMSSPTPSLRSIREPDFTTFISFMKRACPNLKIQKPSTASPNDEVYESVSIHKLTESGTENLSPTFLNALAARLFFDFLQSEKWTNKVKELIDRKLHFLKKPDLIQRVVVKDLDLGDSLPSILHASSPVLDKQGLWVDLNVKYVGSMTITIEAYVNFGRKPKDPKDQTSKTQEEPPISRRLFTSLHPMFDEEADDSGESSDSDEEPAVTENRAEDQPVATKSKLSTQEHHVTNTNTASVISGLGKGKLFKYTDSIAKSSVIQNKQVQKVIGKFSTTPLVLSVEIRQVIGTLALNIPPVPTDRIWIGFRTNPSIDIKVKPKLGERKIAFKHVKEWIKTRLLLEFQRMMVCPNMVDLSVPILEFELPP